ncbi:MAG: tyrosine-type recombinase/integrase [Alphaproteobacteria bacterium]
MSLPKGIRKRGNSFSVDITYQGRRLTATTHSFKEAKQKRAELAYLLMHKGAGREVGRKSVRIWTLGRAFDRTVALDWSRSVAGYSRIRCAKTAIKYFGHGRPLNTIDTEAMDSWCSELERIGNADGTINRKFSALSKMMNVALDRNGLDTKPKVPFRKELQNRTRFLTREEETTLLQLLRHWGRTTEADAFTVLIDTGVRIGELVRLTDKDIDFAKGMIEVWSWKSGRARSVPMTKRVRAIVKRRYVGKRDHKLFPPGHHFYRRAWDRARTHMGLADDPQFVIHALRHTCASRLVQGGVNLLVVKEWMGHAGIQVTLRYAHLTPINFLEAVKVLESRNMVSLDSTMLRSVLRHPNFVRGSKKGAW